LREYNEKKKQVKDKFKRLDGVWEKLMNRIKVDGICDKDNYREHEEVKGIEQEIIEKILEERKPLPTFIQRHILFEDLNDTITRFEQNSIERKDSILSKESKELVDMEQSDDSNAEWDIKSEVKSDRNEIGINAKKESIYETCKQTIRKDLNDYSMECKDTRASREQSLRDPVVVHDKETSWQNTLEYINSKVRNLDNSLHSLKSISLPNTKPYESKGAQTEYDTMNYETTIKLDIKGNTNRHIIRVKTERKNSDDEIENRSTRKHKSFIRHSSSIKTIELEEEEKNELSAWPMNKGLISMKSHLNEVAKSIAKDYKPHHKNRDSLRFMNITNI